jgi:hypothetical protein
MTLLVAQNEFLVRHKDRAFLFNKNYGKKQMKIIAQISGKGVSFKC